MHFATHCILITVGTKWTVTDLSTCGKQTNLEIKMKESKQSEESRNRN